MTSPAAPPRSLGSPRAIAWSWLVHGGLLVVLALLLDPLAAQVADEAWAEAMVLLGAGAWIDPLRVLMPAVAAQTPGIAILGVLCVLAALLAFRWGWRWPLQTVAGAHLVLLPLATWWTRRQVAAVWPATPLELAAEWLTTLIGMGLVAWGMVVVHRAGPARND